MTHDPTGPQEVYWDLTVDETHNYVTVDGTIHHNSGKSVACVMEMFRRAKETPAQEDGARRAQAVITRNTLNQIKSTCLKTWMEWLRPITRHKIADNMLEVRAPLPDGTRIELDVFLLPLDTPENIDRLLSLELTFAWLSEVREIPVEVLQNVFGRTGRFPPNDVVKEYWRGVWAETNSFSIDSDWFEFLEVKRPSGVDYFVQPGARSPNAENLDHLRADYYPALIENNSEAWVRSYVDNELMPSLSGQAVFASSFDREDHVAETELTPMWGRNVIIGLDVGRNPAAVIGQTDTYGRMVVLHALHTENMGIERFINEKMKPVLVERFAQQNMFVCVDPAARNKSQIGEKSVLDAIRETGLNAVLASTNNIAPRLRAVEGYLNRRNGLLMCPVHCADLIHAMQYAYRFKRNRNTKDLDETPEKSHPWSDLCLHVSTMTPTLRGIMPIGSVQVGDAVLGPNGWERIEATALREVPLVRVAWDGGELLCTPDHPVAIWDGPDGYRFTPADALEHGDRLVTGENAWVSGQSRTLASSTSSASVSMLNGQQEKLPSSLPLFSVKGAGRPMSVRFEATDLTSVHAAKSVASVCSAGNGLVVSLTTQNSHQFYSGGVLNHNCDALQYLCLGTESRALAIQLRSATAPQRPPAQEPSALAWS